MNSDELYGRKDELTGQIRALHDELDRTPTEHQDRPGLTRAAQLLTQSLEELQQIQATEEPPEEGH